MSDATDRAAALLLLTEYLQPTVAPVLTTTANTGEVDVILDRNRKARTWVAATAYVVGDVIVPITRNGHRYRCIQPGTSGTTPAFTFWPTSSGATVTEGSSNPILTWQEDGSDAANIYDVRRAAYEGWRLKAQKASQFIQAGDLSFHQVYEHCLDMMDKFRTVMIA